MDLENQAPEILEKNDFFWVMAKPAGWFVHPPSDRRALKKFSNRILTSWLEKNFEKKAFPIHRLDFLTEGVMIWALDSEKASRLNQLHSTEGLRKTYHAIVRGSTPDEGKIEIPLQSDSHFQEVPCLTEYQTLKRIELPVQINSAHATSRYSLVEVSLKTGRWHQIRRHFNRISHPIIGDREHGDSHHNRFFRDQLKIPSLLLRASQIQFECPFHQETRIYAYPLNPRWEKIQDLFSTAF